MQRTLIPCFLVLLVGLCCLSVQTTKVYAEDFEEVFASDDEDEPELEVFASDEEDEPEMEEEDDESVEQESRNEGSDLTDTPPVTVIGEAVLDATGTQSDLSSENAEQTNDTSNHSAWEPAGNTSRQREHTSPTLPPEEKTFTGQIVRMLVQTDPETGEEKVVMQENRLLTDSKGRLNILVDVSDLDDELRGDGLLQLAMKYRRSCGANNAKQPLTQETTTVQFVKDRYHLTLDLCEVNANKIVSIYINEEKDYRSVATMMGSAVMYMLFAKAYSMAKGAPNGDNGFWAETVAAGLPAMPVLGGMDQITEWLQQSDYIGQYAPCVTYLAAKGTMQYLDRDFIADTSKMFATDGARHYARSAAYSQAYKCVKALMEDNIFMPLRNRNLMADEVKRMKDGSYSSEMRDLRAQYYNNATQSAAMDKMKADNILAASDPNAEMNAAIASSVLSTTLLLAADKLKSAEMTDLEKNKIAKLERVWGGLELRGGSAASPYRVWDSVQMGLSRMWDSIPSGQELAYGAMYKAAEYTLVTGVYLAGAAWTYYTAANPEKISKEEQMLATGFFHSVNMMELASFLAMHEFRQQVIAPTVNMITNAAIEREYLSRGSFAHSFAHHGLNMVLSIGASKFTVDVTRFAYNQGVTSTDALKKLGSFATRRAAKSANLLLDVMAGTTTNGLTLPLLLALDEHVFIPVLHEGSVYVCRAFEWGFTCPRHEFSLGVMILPFAKPGEDETDPIVTIKRHEIITE